MFRWVGAATPAQRRVWGITQRVAVVSPDLRRVGRGCPAMARSPRHNGSERGLRGLRGLSEMAALPPPRGQGDARAKPSPPSAARDPYLGNPPGHRSTPLSAGRLRMLLLFCFHGASSNAVWQVPISSASCMYDQHSPRGRDGWSGLVSYLGKEATSVARSAQPHRSPPRTRCPPACSSPEEEFDGRTGCSATHVLSEQGEPYGNWSRPCHP